LHQIAACSEPNIILLLLLVPDASVRILSAFNSSSTSIFVTWAGITRESSYGLVRYRIYFQPSDSSEALNHTDVSHTTRHVNLTGLRKYVAYNITLVPFTSSGEGPHSATKQVMTDTDGKMLYLQFLYNCFEGGSIDNI